MGSSVPISSQAAPSAEQLSVLTGAPWSGRIHTALVVLLLLFEGITKVMKASPVLAAGVRLGLFENLIVAIGITLLACTFLHMIPRTSILGAILLAGYLGGAVFIRGRVGNPLCCQTRCRFTRVAWTVFPAKPACVRRFPCEADLIPFQALGKKEA